ncbi:hypothetical protein V2G26_010083 [Clonostachys chloroleuca]
MRDKVREQKRLRMSAVFPPLGLAYLWAFWAEKMLPVSYLPSPCIIYLDPSDAEMNSIGLAPPLTSSRSPFSTCQCAIALKLRAIRYASGFTKLPCRSAAVSQSAIRLHLARPWAFSLLESRNPKVHWNVQVSARLVPTKLETLLIA